MSKISGIYKITSPTGKIYIGSSKNIHLRWKYYYNLDCRAQIRLYNSIIKHGVENHTFEIIEECEFKKLYSLERAWGLFYNVLSQETGLNCCLPGYGEVKKLISEETRDKQITSHKNISEETRLKMSIAAKNRKPASDETRKKISIGNIGKKHTEETIQKLRNFHLGKKHSEETLIKLSLAKIGRKHSEETKEKRMLRNMKPIIDVSNGKIYSCLDEILPLTKYTKLHLREVLNGKKTNKTTFKYYTEK